MTIKRRDFLRMGSFLTVSVATMGITGCNDSNDDDVTSGSSSGPQPLPPAPEATGAAWKFPQSVASGDPKPDSIILWTRVVPSSIADATTSSSASFSVRLQVTAADNSANLGTDTALAGTLVVDNLKAAYSLYDNTIRDKVTGLTAATTYYYQFVAGSKRSNIGRFKTAPAAAATTPLKFAFMSCQDWNSNHWAAFDDINTNHADDLDFFVHLGDYIYETNSFSSGAAEARHDQFALPKGGSLNGNNFAAYPEDYRFLYKKYRSDLRLQKLHERYAMVAVWDDHEFSDDSWQNAETYTDGNNLQTDRRRAANQSWYEYMPADISFDQADSSFQNIKIYRDLKFGSVMHLVMTDERLYKADHIIPESTTSPLTGQPLGRINSRYLAPEGNLLRLQGLKAKNGLAEGDQLKYISILGKTQREWWVSTMLTSTATWKVWGNEVSLLRMGLNGTQAVGTLIALQLFTTASDTIKGAAATANVQSLPKIAAGAGAAIVNGAAPSTAIPATFAIAQKFAATGSQAEAVGAGMAAGLTQAQATAALSAMGAKTPTEAEITLCAATVVAATSIYMTAHIAKDAATNAAAGAVVSLLVTDAGAGGSAPDANLLAAAKSGAAGITDDQGNVIVGVYKAAKSAAPSGKDAQIQSAVGAFAGNPNSLALIKKEVADFKTTSVFVIASGQAALLNNFLQKFLINADQWDGYNVERKALMGVLAGANPLSKVVQNVVAITGDIHAFFAGQVHAEFKGEVTNVDAATGAETAEGAGGPAVMVDLVTAGVSSSSWFSYLKEAASQLSALLVTLVSATVPKAKSGLPVDIVLPVLDFTLGKPFSTGALTVMAKDSLKKALASAGIPEAAFAAGINPAAPVDAVISGTAQSIASNQDLQLLCKSLAALDSNAWLKHVDSDAQGYSVVEVSPASLKCTFKRVNTLFVSGGVAAAPGAVGADGRPAVARTVVATVNAGSTALTIS